MKKNYRNIVILTGAGISAESGIQTFRASDGLWHNHRIEDVATPEGFKRNPALVHEFYNERRRQLHEPTIQPNAAHLALARLEREFPGNVLLITQNVDDLHDRAGSQNLIHMHGELNKVRCDKTQRVYTWHYDVDTKTPCECCPTVGHLRPHIVWFGEMPFMMETIYDALIDCDLFISIGTSGNVYPAAGFVQIANETGAHTVELNLDASQTSDRFTESKLGKASVLVPQYVDELLASSL
jgi:NAD-dependent deacetylase